MVSETGKLRIALAAGGTGGHLFPAVALGDEMSSRGHDCFFVTERRGASFLGATPKYPMQVVESGTLSGGSLLARLGAAWKLLKGIMQARRIFKQDRPDVVVGFGGYPALPGTIAAVLCRIPVVLHEQNALLGRANKILASRAKFIATSLPLTKGIDPEDFDRTVITGNPVRHDITDLAEAPMTSFAGQELHILVTGGSLGASILSEVVPLALAQMPGALNQRFHVVHQARPADHDAVVRRYSDANIKASVMPFIDDMASELMQAHLVICRAGASTVSELGVIGRPAILVPLPSALDDHQTVNAKLLSDLGGGFLLPQKDFTVDQLAGLLMELFENDGVKLQRASELALKAGRPDAANRLAHVAEAAARNAPLPDSLREFERIGA